MAGNTSPQFVGISELKIKQAETLTYLQKLASIGDWKQLHHTHFDWWMFPIDEPSASYHLAYTVFESDVLTLVSDEAYLTRYRDSAVLLARSWGWDLSEARPLLKTAPDQCWQNWPIRLWKATRSLEFFGEQESFQSFRKYGQLLLSRGARFVYPREPEKDITSLFR